MTTIHTAMLFHLLLHMQCGTKKLEFFAAPLSPSWFGLAPISVGILLYWVGSLGGEYYTLYISSWFLLVGLCWLHLGWQRIKTIRFAFILLLAMFPLPNFVYKNVSLKLQLISSQLGVALIRLYGISAYREGNVIDLGSHQLQVVDACNGLRYLLPLMVLGLILAHFFRASLWKKTLLFLSTIPLAVGVNAFRVALMGVVAESGGPDLMAGFAHAFSGWVVFMAALIIVLLEMIVLQKVGINSFRRTTRTAGCSAGIDAANPGANSLRQSEALSSDRVRVKSVQGCSAGSSRAGGEASGRSAGGHSRFGGAVFLLACTLILSLSFDTRETVAIRQPLRLFPSQIGEWQGKPLAIDSEILSELHLSDYTLMEYACRDKQPVQLYIAYYASQRGGQSCHSPATCLPGTGWVFEQSGLQSLKAPNHAEGFLEVSRAFIQKLGDRQLVYYWFPQRGRVLTNLYELKLYTFWDILTQRRSDGALVRLITRVSGSERVEDADRRMQDFAGVILPLIDQFVPGKSLD